MKRGRGILSLPFGVCHCLFIICHFPCCPQRTPTPALPRGTGGGGKSYTRLPSGVTGHGAGVGSEARARDIRSRASSRARPKTTTVPISPARAVAHVADEMPGIL